MRRPQMIVLCLILAATLSCAEQADRKPPPTGSESATKTTPSEEKSRAVVTVENEEGGEKPVVVAKDESLPKETPKGDDISGTAKGGDAKKRGPTSKPRRPSSGAPPAPPLGSPTAEPAPKADVIKVLYGTNREANGSIRSDPRNDDERQKLPYLYTAKQGRLQVGVAEVSVPRNRKVGETPKAGLVGRSDPGTFFLLLSITPDSAKFESTLETEVSGASDEAIVFIHGYNVPFADAIFRAAQIKADLEFEGAMLAFSWPSQGMAVLYPQDQVYAESDASRDALVEFLRLVAKSKRVKRIHVVAHSMGNRPTQRALAKLVDEGPAAKLGEIVFAAPDVNTESNWFVKEVLPRFSQIGRRRTLYLSHADVALALSSVFHLGEQRLGEDVREADRLPGLNSVDAGVTDASLLGHSYYGGVPTVLDDVKGVLRGLSPKDRHLVLLDKAHDRWTFKIANPILPPILQVAALLFATTLAFLLGRWSKRRLI